MWRAGLMAGGVIVAVRTALVPTDLFTVRAAPLPRAFDTTLPLLVGLVMACAALRTRRSSARLASAWGLFALAYLSYGAAELPFAAFNASMSTPYLSELGLVLYLLYYPLFLAGTLRLPPAPLARRHRISLALDMSIVMLGAGFLLWSFIVVPAMSRGGPEPLRIVATVAYPIAGLGILWSLLTLVFRRLAEPAPGVVRLLAASAVCMIVTDVGYSYHLLFPSDRLWAFLGVGWTAGHVLAALAPMRQISAVDAAAPPRSDAEQAHLPLAPVYLSYAMMTVAVAALVWMHFRWLSAVGGVALVAMIVLGAIRKVIGLKENEGLKEGLRAARDTLEERVQERTAELARANVDLQREVTERRRAEKRLSLQLERLAALRAVDAAISASLDLRVTLGVFLDNVIEQLAVDAADVLLLNPVSQMLESFARKGFRHGDTELTPTPVGAGHAGRAALERMPVIVPDLTANPDLPPRTSAHGSEGFSCYWAFPLVVRGHLKGVLEVYSRSPLTPDHDWIDYLSTLAGQGAIAIDSMALFERTQRSNIELALAYDSTLEGWSLALELRDHETRGHTLRVADLTVRLARELGMSDEELVQARRGALLHDIGKMAVPDAVLLKPGPLTDDEWRTMRRHPVHAFELLSRIAYLRPALDIPYCHHERWDGTGYPRGLAGEQIPLAARAFAVVDNWDALSFDRPYRRAWPEDRVREHLRDSSGTMFDPRVVDTFISRCV